VGWTINEFVLNHRGVRDQLWTMVFAQDAFASGRKFRTLNLMDGFTREAPAIEADSYIGTPAQLGS
jgi:putative transposase